MAVRSVVLHSFPLVFYIDEVNEAKGEGREECEESAEENGRVRKVTREEKLF